MIVCVVETIAELTFDTVSETDLFMFNIAWYAYVVALVNEVYGVFDVYGASEVYGTFDVYGSLEVYGLLVV